MNEMKNIENINVSQLEPHPNNPRKEIRDIEELTESVRKNGIMQNLTVVPIEGESDRYRVIIGHRRLTAAKAAGIESVPCRIARNLSENEQYEIMLMENIQRNDLTVYEQAAGFQMMIDMGETVESITEKTGFSKTTIYHRLNIAKLNQNTLKKKEEDESFQLSIKDLYILEKVKKVSDRNKILKSANDSRELINMAKSKIRDDMREENAKKILKELKDRNLVEKPTSRYTWEYDTVKTFNLDQELKEIKLRKTSETLYYSYSYGHFYILKERKNEKVNPKEKEEMSEKAKEERKNKRTLKKIQTELYEKIKDYVRQIVLGNVEQIDEDIFNDVRKLAFEYSVFLDKARIYKIINEIFYGEDKSYYVMNDEEKELIEKMLENIPCEHEVLLLMTEKNLDRSNVYSYYLTYSKETANKVSTLVKILKKFGMQLTEDEEKFLDGSHEAFSKGR